MTQRKITLIFTVLSDYYSSFTKTTMLSYRLVIIFALLSVAYTGYSQNDSADSKVGQLPGNYYQKVDRKLSSVNSKLTKKSEKYLLKLQRQESRMQQKLAKIDSLAADNLFVKAENKYARFSESLSGKVSVAGKSAGEYIPYMDSLGTSLKFLSRFKSLNGKAKESLSHLHLLQDKLQQSGKIKDYIAERKQQIKEALSKYTKLPGGLKKQFDKLNKTAYYYSAQVQEYKEMLKDPSKAEKKALSLLNKLPAFQKFMQKNSMLASLFRLPGSSAGEQNQPASLAGLQTRASVQAIIQPQILAGGPNAQQIIQQNLAQAHNELDKLKEKLRNSPLGGGGSGGEMPDFKPNSQKTKSFLKRLEYGANVQFAKSNNLFPSTTNIGVSLGYKLNDKSIIGIGIAYKMGMGTLKHIVISHEGIGLRSFVDYKIKGSLYMSGGYEMNYNSRFKNIEQLKRFNDWQSSGLIGISKKYRISKKVKGEMKLLYDFLANEHTPVTQPVVFRMGYNLKNF